MYKVYYIFMGLDSDSAKVCMEPICVTDISTNVGKFNQNPYLNSKGLSTL